MGDDWFTEADPRTSQNRYTHNSCVIRQENNKKTYRFLNESLASNCLATFDELRGEGQLCDVFLDAVASEGTEDAIEVPITINAHRVVLAAASPYFRGMFCSSLMESTSDRIQIKEVDGATLRDLVDYMYTGRLEIDENNVQSLLSTSTLLQLNCVRDACSRFLLEELDASNCLGIAIFAQTYSCQQLLVAARTFMQQHFRDLLNSDELLALSFEHLFTLVSDDFLSTNGEEVVFEAVIKWIRHDLSRKKHLPQLLKAVRLPQIPDEYFFNEVKEEPLVKESSECKDILLDACQYLIKHELSNDKHWQQNWLKPRIPVPLSQIIMLVGGQAPKAIPNIDLFDPDCGEWQTLPFLGSRRCRCGVAVIGNQIYVIGGFNGSARVRSVDVFDRVTNTWSQGSDMDARRSTLGVTVMDGILYAIGGFDGSTGLSSAEMHDPRQRQWMSLPSMSTRRSSVGVAAMNGIIYAIGGYDGLSRQCLNTVELYDPRANRWHFGPSMNNVRSGAGVTLCNGGIVAVGGHEGADVRASAEMFIDDEWRTLPNMGTRRRNASVIALNNKIYAIGGDEGSDNLDTMEVLQIDPTLNTTQWETLEAKLPAPRSYAGIALLPK